MLIVFVVVSLTVLVFFLSLYISRTYINNFLSRDGIAVEYKKEDLPQVNPQLYKRLATINGKSFFDNSIAQWSENVNAENVKNGKLTIVKQVDIKKNGQQKVRRPLSIQKL